jgi:tetratricopeptide (TPR) repeat protein
LIERKTVERAANGVNWWLTVLIMPKKTNSPRRKATLQQLNDLDLEIHFMEGVTQRDPFYLEALQILGDDYTRRDRFEEGLRIDERLARLCPQDAIVHYNLACSYSLTRQCDLAVEVLTTAINLGYKDFDNMAKDPDLKNLREHAGYKKIQARIRRTPVKET